VSESESELEDDGSVGSSVLQLIKRIDIRFQGYESTVKEFSALGVD